jgi:acyl dehydratase
VGLVIARETAQNHTTVQEVLLTWSRRSLRPRLGEVQLRFAKPVQFGSRLQFYYWTAETLV